MAEYVPPFYRFSEKAKGKLRFDHETSESRLTVADWDMQQIAMNCFQGSIQDFEFQIHR